MNALEEKIQTWRQELLASGIKMPAVLDELESHLRDTIEQGTKAGLTAEQAFEIAVKQIGESKNLKAEFSKTKPTSTNPLQKYFLPMFATTVGSCLLGGIFCLFVMVPLSLKASMQYANWLGFQTADWSAPAYLSFVSRFTLGTGLAFAMPALVLCLVRFGYLSSKQLVNFRYYAIVINLVLGALMTTPIVLTQILTFLMLQSLYEITVLIAKYWKRKDQSYVQS